MVEHQNFFTLFKRSPLWQKAVFIAVALGGLLYSLWMIDIERRPSQGYDEEMWTGASISTYHMLFKGYVRPTQKLDNWFPTYAYKNGVDVFVDKLGETRLGGRIFPYNRLAFFDPDTLRFPWDFIQWDTLGQAMSFAVKYDTLKFPRTRFQWVDNALWTFGWKAPNVGKAIMGFCIENFSKEKPDPFGYFEYRDPEGTPTNVTFNYVPHKYLALARIPNALFTAGTIKLVFLLGWLWLGFWPGFLAALFLVFNIYFIQSSTAVGLDGSSIFFMVASLACFQNVLNSIDNPSWKGWGGWTLGTALLFGLGVGSKLNDALFAYIATGLLGVLVLIKIRKFRTNKISVLKLILSGFIIIMGGGAVFLAFNPLYRDQPLAMMRTTRQSVDGYFSRRAKDQRTKFTPVRGKEYVFGHAGPGAQYPVTDTLRAGESIALAEGTRVGSWQVASHKKKQSYVNTKELRPYIEVVEGKTSDKYRLLFKRNFLVVEPDRYYGTLGHLLPFPGNPLDGFFTLLGWFLLLFSGWRLLIRQRLASPALLITLGFLVLFVGTADFIWIDFSRYHIVLYPLMSLCFGYGLHYSGLWILKKINKKEKTPFQSRPQNKMS
ncbi:MAG: phospholipid carrier-dependent glycosyltransferase [Flavobacteriales bacterium]|nr:phospholipid carrier-dependent glycosyltransferase [Flavobacteriales bacterium]MDW8431400.1 phospholipid carrier-dependent glycosyltransferase [Flavobacteriales bacterium]